MDTTTGYAGFLCLRVTLKDGWVVATTESKRGTDLQVAFLKRSVILET